MKDFLELVRNLMKSSPQWLKICASVLLALLAAIMVFVSSQSCSTIRVVGNDGAVSTTVRQSALDSMNVKVEFSPNFSSYGKER